MTKSDSAFSQKEIPIDTSNWFINAQSYVLENFKGKDAIYLQNGRIHLKDEKFLDGTIEFDVFLTERQSFPGVFFRQVQNHAEAFFLRPHLSGKPDANQGSPIVNGIQAFQLYFGEPYSVAYEYNFSDWTHIKLVVNDMRAQAYFDYSETPNLSWDLVNQPKEGTISIGTSFAPMHFANIKIDRTKKELIDFKVKGKREPVANIIQKWKVSEKFDEELLSEPSKIEELAKTLKFDHTLSIVENIAIDISQAHNRYDQVVKGNTVFAKVVIDSDIEQLKLFDFGYSDRVVVILNNKPIYRGNNKWRSRDYRYLGTIGFFDSVYLPLMKGENVLLLAVSEDFGGWLASGKFGNMNNITIKEED